MKLLIFQILYASLNDINQGMWCFITQFYVTMQQDESEKELGRKKIPTKQQNTSMPDGKGKTIIIEMMFKIWKTKD